MLQGCCEQLGAEVMCSPDALHLLGAHRLQPDLVITDVQMPSGNGLSLGEFSSATAAWRVPVIVISGRADETTLQRCSDLGAHFVKKGPQLWSELKPLNLRLLGRSGNAAPDGPAADGSAAYEESLDFPETRRWVLCIDDDPDISRIIQMRLIPFGVDVQRAFRGMQGFWSAIDMRPDVIISDMIMPDGEGNYILSRIRANPLTKHTPVIVLTGKRDVAMGRQMLALGANAYLFKPINLTELFDHLRQFIPLAAEPLAGKGSGSVPPEPCQRRLGRPRFCLVSHVGRFEALGYVLSDGLELLVSARSQGCGVTNWPTSSGN